ncbi:hypothetical protein PHYBLDRAFT_79153 [Phycomyces blakesleeanus NRRL 1555(-)]|uniref:HD domain-containing protein n=1 Tax=Phycomyces blakesleeanus (strain ATCC 8743b / DSM 1359 / FGSC 10004 / NBRC 33097 / NRRL 1555) TaxID=763407 RepID=A0A167PIM2_PHYB8|nr:hypothetical protein PHYBLDRAFT_79153 [Phycomyces blakesleeanus NRRL 1555(-)]OAD78014.1 hypothetical protein PHYBLDRAFT_79153 [Phycomyces blakesleeanus NRRL 1555(-)]|eukprot:XP_018296054.1 hypothetical protein PHYBLDRAFT_79153 [Phycomyces blakesleeanus NRRL 1555(-)]
MDKSTFGSVIDAVFKVLIDGNADDETVLAALLHDIGQFVTSPDHKEMLFDAAALTDLDPAAAAAAAAESSASVSGSTTAINLNTPNKKKISVGVTGHERIGAEYLRSLGFSEKVAVLVEAHVPVKRYLTGKYPEYYDGLSGASKLSLKYQGGPYTAKEVALFEKDPLFELKVQVRQWDDAAKVVDLKVPGLEYYRPMAIRHLEEQASNRCSVVV